MSFKDIETALQGVQDTVQTGQNQLTNALGFLETARETLQGTAEYSAVAEHARAVGLFQEAEAGINALRTRLEQFHPAIASYIGSLGMNAPEADPDKIPDKTAPDQPAPDSNTPEIRPDPGQAPPEKLATEDSELKAAHEPTTEPAPLTSDAESSTPEPQFKEVAEDLQAQVSRMHWKRGADPNAIEGFIDAGVEQYVFDIADGTKVAKVSKYGNWDNKVEVSLADIQKAQDRRVEAMERVKGREGYEQLDEVIEVSPHLPAVMVYDKAPGDKLINLPPEELDQIPEEHMDKLVANVAFANQNNIWLDTAGAGNNVLYDPDKGFTIIDFSSLKNSSTFVMPPDTDMVRRYARQVLFDNPQPGITPLPQAKKTFYRSFKKAFGDEAAKWLKFDFSIRHTIPDDL